MSAPDPIREAFLLTDMGRSAADGTGVLGTLDEPHFDKARRVHDWRNYVPEAVAATWTQLSEDTRMAIVVMASTAAEREHWD